jgi:membrane-bound ClpP family serine protease
MADTTTETQAAQPQQAAHAAEADEHETPHLPDPSIWPIVLALGISTLVTGIALNLVVIIAGLIIATIALVGWIYQDIQIARRGEDHH